jgi:hypothetical protein
MAIENGVCLRNKSQQSEANFWILAAGEFSVVVVVVKVAHEKFTAMQRRERH